MSKFKRKNILLRENPLEYFLYRAEESKLRAERWEEKSIAFTERHPKFEHIANSLLCVAGVLGIAIWLWGMI